MEIRPLTKQDEENFPEFESHQEASQYLKELYGDYFINQIIGSEYITVDGVKVYPYMLILDKNAFSRMEDWIEDNNTFVFPTLSRPETREFSGSFQRVLIHENGKIQAIGAV